MLLDSSSDSLGLELRLMMHHRSNYDKENFCKGENFTDVTENDGLNFSPKLDFKTFSNIILPRNNPDLREMMSERKLVGKESSDSAASRVLRHLLTGVLHSEIKVLQ